MKNVKFETEEYSIPANEYFKNLMVGVLLHYWWVPILVSLTSIMLAMLIDIAFIFVGLIILFIIFPMLSMFIYLNYSTQKETRIAILRKKIKFCEEGFEIVFSPICKKDMDGNFTGECVNPKPYYIHKKEINRIENMGNKLKISLKGGHNKFILVPICYINGWNDEYLAYILQYISSEE